MIHYDIIQGTEEWHVIKWGKIGGTRSDGAFIDSDTLVNKLVAEQTETFQLDDSYQSNAMLRGQDLEPVLRDRIQDYTGVNFIDAGWIDSDIENVGNSPDGISECETIMYEGKCPAGKEHIDTCRGGKVPIKHTKQVLHYFTCNPKLETMYFVSFRPESKVKPLFVVEWKLDSVVDIGLTKKVEVEVIGKKGTPIKPKLVTVADLRTVAEWVKVARASFIELNSQVNTVIDELKF